MKTRTITAIFMMIGLNVIAQIPNYVPTDGLVGWYPFNGNANDESGNGNNGTPNNQPLLDEDRFGLSNSSYLFDGVDDALEINATPALLPTNITISGWVRKPVNPEGINGHVVRSRFYGYIVFASNTEENLNFQLHHSSNSSDWTITSVSTANWQHTEWHHFVGTFDGVSNKLYIDGILVDQEIASSSTIIYGSDGLVVIGRDGNTFGVQGASHYTGHIDDIGIWNRALTEEEIQNLYNANICYDHVTVTDTLIINFNMTGFNPVTYEHSIEIYPNPTSDHITINYGDFIGLNGYTLSIFNPMGQLVHTSNITQQQEYLDLNSWGGVGVYNVVIYNPQGGIVSTKQIVLQ
jgi:hypothetical protein